MTLTVRCHYIPCFWAAYWNANYHANDDYRKNNKARDQVVYALSLKSRRTYQTTVDRVFFEKEMNISEVCDQTFSDFTKRNFPPEQHFHVTDESTEETTFLDFEGHYSAMDMEAMEIVSRINQTRTIRNEVDRAELLHFMLCLLLRNYKTVNQQTETYNKQNKPKFEFLWQMQQALSNRTELMSFIVPLCNKKWRIYRTVESKFPLSDSPVLFAKKSLLFALSPTLLIEILFNEPLALTEPCEVKSSIESSKYAQYLNLLVNSCEREIIFPQSELLQQLLELKK